MTPKTRAPVLIPALPARGAVHSAMDSTSAVGSISPRPHSLSTSAASVPAGSTGNRKQATRLHDKAGTSPPPPPPPPPPPLPGATAMLRCAAALPLAAAAAVAPAAEANGDASPSTSGGTPLGRRAERRGEAAAAAASPLYEHWKSSSGRITGPTFFSALGSGSGALELEEGAARDILSRAQVVAATCIGCGEPRMQALCFPVVVLDEATQATEPHSLVPLLAQAQQVVLVGDPQQLPPTVRVRGPPRPLLRS
ncbi:Regulator of nonsense transcripts 1 [Tetrabaena socialis]|uniref:Regulator of nonsense transcripts 1 n=1 Tax=Tetrabaena socialis TaxID=47790 RepID=A0A2J7ZWA5_9CHLO|nr:Regulator of nonsense transcripts 1 [Tetrabaena socialis]|eukprot:PNH04536.1 Regulator of nonsense transcripts 1 [Tetrabaena socialis]